MTADNFNKAKTKDLNLAELAEAIVKAIFLDRQYEKQVAFLNALSDRGNVDFQATNKDGKTALEVLLRGRPDVLDYAGVPQFSGSDWHGGAARLVDYLMKNQGDSQKYVEACACYTESMMNDKLSDRVKQKTTKKTRKPF